MKFIEIIAGVLLFIPAMIVEGFSKMSFFEKLSRDDEANVALTAILIIIGFQVAIFSESVTGVHALVFAFVISMISKFIDKTDDLTYRGSFAMFSLSSIIGLLLSALILLLDPDIDTELGTIDYNKELAITEGDTFYVSTKIDGKTRKIKVPSECESMKTLTVISTLESDIIKLSPDYSIVCEKQHKEILEERVQEIKITKD